MDDTALKLRQDLEVLLFRLGHVIKFNTIQNQTLRIPTLTHFEVL